MSTNKPSIGAVVLEIWLGISRQDGIFWNCGYEGYQRYANPSLAQDLTLHTDARVSLHSQVQQVLFRKKVI